MERLMERFPVNQSTPTKASRREMDGDYPSLPGADRCDSVERNLATRESPHVYPPHRPERGLRKVQPEMPADNSEGTLKTQIAALEKQRCELLSINKKWSEQYQLMIQFYKDKVLELKVLLQSDRPQEALEPGQNHDVLQKNVKSKTAIENKDRVQNQNGDVGFELRKSEQEAKLLRAKNNTLARREQHQHKEIRRLNKALEEALQMPVSSQEGSGTSQELWRHQAEVYKEDFMKERRDREKLKQKHLELEKNFRKVHSELCSIKSKITWAPDLPQHIPEFIDTRCHLPTKKSSDPPVIHCHCQAGKHTPR